MKLAIIIILCFLTITFALAFTSVPQGSVTLTKDEIELLFTSRRDLEEKIKYLEEKIKYLENAYDS